MMDIKNRKLGTRNGICRLPTSGPKLNGEQRHNLTYLQEGVLHGTTDRRNGWETEIEGGRKNMSIFLQC